MTYQNWLRVGLLVVLVLVVAIMGTKQQRRIATLEARADESLKLAQSVVAAIERVNQERQQGFKELSEALERETAARIDDDQGLGRVLAALDTREAEHFKRSMRGKFR